MNPIIVVEGKDDTRRLKEVFPDIETIETQGSAINEETLALIKKAHEVRDVIVFTDPDYPGQRIRSIIQQAIPTVSHAFIEREEAVRKSNQKSLGVEHASDESIKRALEQVYHADAQAHKTVLISQSTLMKLGLIGFPQSAQLREQVTRQLRIGHTNGKQLAKRLNLFGITQEELEAAVDTVTERSLERDYI